LLVGTFVSEQSQPMLCNYSALLLVLTTIAAFGNPSKPASDAAHKFLATLTDKQSKRVVYDFKDEAQRKRWSNLPTRSVKRGGLRMGDLNKQQREAAMSVLAAALSKTGYEKTTQIVQADQVLEDDAGRKMLGRDEYYISFVGQPSETKPWMLQFGGHHLGINVTFVGDRSTIAPTHTGAQPAIYQFEGKTVRPLGGEIDKAFELLTSLDQSQREQAVLGFQMHDLVLGPGRDGQTIQPEGIKASAFNEKQRDILVSLINEWVSIMNDTSAKQKMADVKQHLDETWFTWSGPAEKGKGYFRIQGPTVFIEYAPQRLGGDVTKHIHTIYREPQNDYGAEWLKK
jgi:hypothetical protein